MDSPTKDIATPPQAPRWLNWLAVLTAALVFPLIFVGGLVTSKDAGLAVPDWPTSFGYSMFLLPWSKMVGGIFYEHSHRLLGSIVGLTTLTLAICLALRERRGWVKNLGWVALAAVCIQGLMGGLRVTELAIELAVVHGCFAQAFFSLVCFLALVTSQSWQQLPESKLSEQGARFARVSSLLVAAVFFQLMLGAIFRHLGQLLEFHIMFALGVASLIIFVFRESRVGEPSSQRCLRYPALALVGLLVVQLFLGFGSYLAVRELGALHRGSSMQFVIPTLHVAVGATILATSVILSARAHRLYRRPDQEARPVESTQLQEAAL